MSVLARGRGALLAAAAVPLTAAVVEALGQAFGLPGLLRVVGVLGVTAVVTGIVVARGGVPLGSRSGAVTDTAQVAHGVKMRTEEMTGNIEKLSAEANSISFMLMMQNGASEGARDSMNEMATSISRVATLVEATELSSRRVSELAGEGESRAHSALADLDNLASAFAAIEQQVRPLIEQAAQISVAADLIHRIASQTKLLSLNATIEAVRAGERGSGFAVVAEEVRKLADGSSSASRQISGTVAAIQQGTAAVAEGIERASETVHAGLEHLSRTLELLGPIRREADTTLHQTREVTSAVQAENELTLSVVTAMGEVLQSNAQTESVVNQTLETSSAMAQLTDAILEAIAPWTPVESASSDEACGTDEEEPPEAADPAPFEF